MNKPKTKLETINVFADETYNSNVIFHVPTLNGKLWQRQTPVADEIAKFRSHVDTILGDRKYLAITSDITSCGKNAKSIELAESTGCIGRLTALSFDDSVFDVPEAGMQDFMQSVLGMSNNSIQTVSVIDKYYQNIRKTSIVNQKSKTPVDVFMFDGLTALALINMKFSKAKMKLFEIGEDQQKVF